MTNETDNLLLLNTDEMDDEELVSTLAQAADKSKLAIEQKMPLHAGMYAEVAAHCANELARRRPDIHFITLDHTHLYQIDEEDAPLIEKIVDIYSWDANTRTHLCEMTPSYWLTHHANAVYFVSEGINPKVEERIYNRYENIRDENGGVYVHCHELDGIKEKLEAEPFRYFHLGQAPYSRAEYDTEKAYEDAVDEWVREAYCTGATSL